MSGAPEPDLEPRSTLQEWWRRRLTGLLEPLRRRFEDRRERYAGLRRRLNQAHFGVTYDDYLTRVAVTAVTGGVAVTLLVFLALSTLTALSGLDLAATVVDAALSLVAGVLAGVLAWYVGYTRPRRVARRRARKLDVALPGVVAYMYALAHGGLNPVEVVRRTAAREDVYGEAAREMGMVVNDMEYLGTDFVSALENAAEVTPCDRTADLLTDMVGVLETGGDFEAFLADRRSQVVEQLSSEQESYLERLGLYAEMYVTLLVAGPLFVIVLLLVIGILGSSTLPQVATLTYVGLPLGSAFAVVALDVFGAPVTGGEGGAASPPERPRPAVPDDPDARAYAERKRRAQRRDRLLDPVEELVRSPARSLYATVPLALVVAGVVALSGLATPSVAALRSQPVWTTAFLGLLPFLVVTVPLAVLGELRARYARRVRERFPDLLSSIARANRTGVSIVEAIEMEADRSTGVVERELRELRNDIRWFSDPSAAFRRFAARARLSITTRTMTLVAEANDASGDLQRTLSVAADDARFQRTFTRSRAREVATYVAVAVISFLVFLGILVLVQEFYLQRAVEAAAGASTSDLAADLPGSLQDIDVAGFRVAFLHAAVIQGACIGFVAGKLARGTVLVGVKYSIVMSTLALAAFGVVV